MIAVSCDVTFGSSGAPVFDASGWRPKIVSIISRGSRDEEGSTALGMELPKLVEDLYFALRTGKGVFPKPKTGALFVRP